MPGAGIPPAAAGVESPTVVEPASVLLDPLRRARRRRGVPHPRRGTERALAT